MPLQRVRRIIGRTQSTDILLLQQADGILLPQLFPRFLPDRWRGFGRQWRVDVKVTLQLQMRPVVKWAAGQLRHHRRPRQELLITIGIACDPPLLYATGAHRPPFIMIGFQPQFRQITKDTVLGNISG